MEEVVVIVGAGPAGLATSACLNILSIPNVLLEKEDCSASLWKNRAYDRLKLHLGKEFCHLPHMPFPPNAPTFVSRADFVSYLDNYAANFKVNPKCSQSVESAVYDEITRKWRVEAKHTVSGEITTYISQFLVVATGENSEGIIPHVPGLESFDGEVIHSNQYKSGSKYNGQEVLVVGSGNSGMEIAYDLSNYGALTSIVVRSPFHFFTKEMIRLGMRLLNHFPCNVVDFVMVMLAKLRYGDMSKYGLHRPEEGPFFLKAKTGRSPVIDVGAVERIKKGEIKVLPEISSIEKNTVAFNNGYQLHFDALIFATGYRSTANSWLKNYDYLLNNQGMPKSSFPNHWKGSKGAYCAGLSQRGLSGISKDAQTIANDVKKVLSGIDDKKNV